MSTRKTGDLERAAESALTAGHAALDAGAPLASRAWADGAALLVVVRGSRLRSRQLAALQDSIADSVYLRTGEMLRPCGLSADAERDLVVLAFERILADTLAARHGPGEREPLAGSG